MHKKETTKDICRYRKNEQATIYIKPQDNDRKKCKHYPVSNLFPPRHTHHQHIFSKELSHLSPPFFRKDLIALIIHNKRTKAM